MMLERGLMAEDGTQLLEQLMRFKPDGLTANAWAIRAGVGRTIWADLRRHGNPSRRTLEKLLAVAGSSLAEFEALRVGTRTQISFEHAGLAERGQPWRQAPMPPLPLFRTAQAGAWGDRDPGIPLMSIDRDTVVDRLARPASLAVDRDAYAVSIVGESMWPRFRLGRRIAVSPSSPVGVGDDVLVLLVAGQGTLLGELRRHARCVSLRQFNPSVEFDVSAAEVEAIHKVMGELI
jgi:SOS-response transcriptional repressor LexA